MFYGTQRHQRDMFTGDLGIPDITSHVGNVVHTFETMAMMRQLAEQEKRRRHSHYLPSKYDNHQMSSEHHNSNNRKYNKLKQKPTTSSRSKQKLTLSKRLSLSSKNYSFIPKLSQSHKTDTKNTKYKDHSIYTIHHRPLSYTPTVTAILKNSTNLNLDDDYRRNLYKQQLLPTTMNRLTHKATPTQTPIDGDNDEENIINKAFNEIFINYDDTGEEEGHEEAEEVGVNDEKLIYHHNGRGAVTSEDYDYDKENKLFKIPPNSSQLEAAVDPSLVRHHHHHYHLHHPRRNDNEVKRTTTKFIS